MTLEVSAEELKSLESRLRPFVARFLPKWLQSKLSPEDIFASIMKSLCRRPEDIPADHEELVSLMFFRARKKISEKMRDYRRLKRDARRDMSLDDQSVRTPGASWTLSAKDDPPDFMPHFSEVVELLESEWFASLSSGQQSVLAGTLFGVEDEEIAKSLNRTSRTVRTYRKEVEDSLCVYLDLRATSSGQLDKDHAE